MNTVQKSNSIYTKYYQDGYEAGYKACDKAHVKRMKQRKYFIKQKMIGVMILVFTICSLAFLDGDLTISFLTIPIGCMFLFTKKMILMDNYYFKNERGKNEL
ncbi:hypothetical protein [Anaerostipes sp. PC18]|uniref:hypothetical protein n=1 Tax=Anaerostipes sp. PC18 TaxID=3036926 RepID=UPI003085133C|nr:hypothetical protein P8F77_10290 [Anaerostipes sp. PC18]